MLKGSRGHSFGLNGGILADKMALGKTVRIVGEVVNSLRFPEQYMIVRHDLYPTRLPALRNVQRRKCLRHERTR